LKRRSPQASASPGLALRIAALGLVLDVIEGRRPLEAGFEKASAGLSPRDRAFVRRLATTALRRFGQADALIAALLDKGPLSPKQSVLRSVLVIGATELLFLATPAHAAIDNAVNLARSRPALAGQAGLVNALLRRLQREIPDAAAAEAKAPPRLNLPAWLAARWCRHYGAAKTESIAAAHRTEPPLDITVKADPALWAEKLGAAILPTGSLRRPLGGAIGALPGFEEGAWWIQDAAAALPARLLGPVDGIEVLDLCAAPGGKTAQLAAGGARVTALDQDAGRLARLEMNMRRLKLAAAYECADALTFRPPRLFPRVLLDAPCSATGTLRRHPDLPWLKREEDLPRFAALQAELLDAAARVLAPGGLLVYSVCSLEPEEGEAQAEALIARDPALALEPIGPAAWTGIAPFVTAQGALRTTPADWPELGNLDGFYVGRFRRRI
jgi:16S rRNA (cytosine967-C5)-methyltransferase